MAQAVVSPVARTLQPGRLGGRFILTLETKAICSHVALRITSDRNTTCKKKKTGEDKLDSPRGMEWVEKGDWKAPKGFLARRDTPPKENIGFGEYPLFGIYPSLRVKGYDNSFNTPGHFAPTPWILRFFEDRCMKPTPVVANHASI